MSDKSSSPVEEWRLAYGSSDVDEEIGMDRGCTKRGPVDMIPGGDLEDGEMRNVQLRFWWVGRVQKRFYRMETF